MSGYNAYLIRFIFIIALSLLPQPVIGNTQDENCDKLSKLGEDCQNLREKKVCFPTPVNFEKLREIHHILMSYYSAPQIWGSKSFFFNIESIKKKTKSNNNKEGDKENNTDRKDGGNGGDRREDYEVFLDLMLNWNIENWKPNKNIGIDETNKDNDKEKVLSKFKKTYSKCKWLMAFWYPEAFLLHHRKPATQELYDRWRRYLNSPSKELDEKEFSSELCVYQDVYPLIETKPILDADGWERLKLSVKERWKTELGRKIRTQILDCLSGMNNSNWKGPKPNIGDEDLRGFHFDDFNCTGCFFKNYDLWNASFTNGHFERSKFFSTKIVNVSFKETELKEVVFTGGDKFDYGPMYSVFNGAKMGASRWENCHLLNVIFIDCSLREAQFNSCVFSNVLIISSDLRNSTFSNCVINENCKAITCLLSDIQFKNTRVPEKIFYFENIEKVNGDNRTNKSKGQQNFRAIAEDIKRRFIDQEATIAQMNEGLFPLNALTEAITKVNIDNSLMIKHHLFGLHHNINYYNSEEEFLLDHPNYKIPPKFTDVNMDADSLRKEICDFQCLIVNNYKTNGRMSRYRQELSRLEYRKNNSGEIENLYKTVDGIVCGFGVNPTRFIFLFIGIAIIFIYHRNDSRGVHFFSIIITALPCYFLVLILDSNAFGNINISIQDISIIYTQIFLIIIFIILYLKFHPEIDIQDIGLLNIAPIFLFWYLFILTDKIIANKNPISSMIEIGKIGLPILLIISLLCLYFQKKSSSLVKYIAGGWLTYEAVRFLALYYV